MKIDPLLSLAESLAGAKDPFLPFETFLRGQGINGFFYGFTGLREDLRQLGFTAGLYHHHSYPCAWEEALGAQSVIDNDHTTAALARGQRFVEWTPADRPALVATLTPEQRRQYDIEADLGMIHGASVLLESTPMVFSGIGLWHETQPSAEGFRREWAERGGRILAAARLLDAAVRGTRPNQLVRLSGRELDCLCWLARGQRPSEICWRIGISEKTFEKHIASAKAKLKSRTRDQALAKSVLLGLLPL